MQPPIRFKKTGEITIEPETDVNPKKPGLFGQSAQTVHKPVSTNSTKQKTGPKSLLS